MKRSFSEFDDAIPTAVWQQFPEHRKQLERIQQVESSVTSLWTSHSRKSLEEYSEPIIVTKVLRIFLRSHFVPANALDRAHYVVSIEGRVLDSAYSGIHFGSFFDSIKVVTVRAPLSSIEWNAQAEPKGRSADCFRFKLYGDRPCPVKVYLTRNDSVQPRYDLSPALREMLPQLRWDPTDEDILMAVWSYAVEKNLMDSRNRTTIRCDEVLPVDGPIVLLHVMLFCRRR
jgi:hypothetical protein